MRAIILFVIGCIFILSVSAAAQTETEFERKYPKIVSYEVRPKIQMRAEFGSDGQVISVTLMPNQISEKENTRFAKNFLLDVFEVEAVFNELVAPQDRIGEPRSLGYLIMGFGGHVFGGFAFDNVRVNTYGSYKNGGIGGKNSCSSSSGVTDTEALWRRFCTMNSEPETVSIIWVNRVPKASGSERK